MNTIAAIGALALLASLSGCGLDVMYADWKVERLCREDGGIAVYIHDAPPKDFKLANGAIDLPALERAKVGDSYYLLYKTDAIESQGPEIRRLEARLVRQSDGKLLGKSVSYIRPTQNIGDPIFHRAAHVCPQEDPVTRMVLDVFSVGNK